MKNNEKKRNVEAFALRPVPPEEQKSWVALAFVNSGMVICIPAFMLGAFLAEGMSTVNGLAAGVVGYLCVLVLMSILGMQGSDLHIPTCAITQSTLGRNGTRLIASSLFAISLMGFFGLQVNVCGAAFTNLLYSVWGVYIPVVISSIVWGLVMTVVAVFGMELFKHLNVWTVPALLIIMLLALILAFRLFSMDGLTTNEVIFPTMSFAQGVGLSFSFFSAAAFAAADITRFQKTRMDTIKSSAWGLMPAGIATLVIGFLLTRVAGIYDITLVLVQVGLPIIGLIVLIITTITTNSLNAYCGGLNLVMTFNIPDNRRREATAAIGVIGTILGAIGILNVIDVYLEWVSFFGAPIAGVMIADYWIVGRGKKENWHLKEGWNWTGLLAVLISLVISLFIPFGVFNINGVAVSIVVYLIIEYFRPSSARSSVQK